MGQHNVEFKGFVRGVRWPEMAVAGVGGYVGVQLPTPLLPLSSPARTHAPDIIIYPHPPAHTGCSG